MDNKISIAVIFTCFNRCKSSINCIEKLSARKGLYNLEFYICDDKSTDGTYEKIRAEFPDVKIEQSNGNLYWSKGMYHAMSMAIKTHHDFYLMVNDDVDFFEDAIQIMLDSYSDIDEDCAIVGSTISNSDGRITYGGRKSIPFRMGKLQIGTRTYELIQPDNNKCVECDYANWNCFLISEKVIEKVGLISNMYAHSLGDYDYSYRMRKKGFKLYIAKNPIGKCERNEQKNTYYDAACPRKKRIKQLFSAKGQPLGSELRYQVRINGLMGVIITAWRYIQYMKCILLKQNIG